MGIHLEEMCRQAHEARIKVGMLDTEIKNRTLCKAADALLAHEQDILAANAKDVENGKANHMPQGLLDRLTLNHERLLGMADGLRQIAGLNDPIGEVLSMKKRPNGLIIGKRRVPIGVIGIIFEARPNVTSDAFGLCFKSGNCAILKGGSDAIHSNIAIVSVMQEALREMDIPTGALSLIESTDRETTNAFMKMKQYVDLLIPRGGKGLIQSVVNNATIPVIETGTGNCHVYVDESADFDMALAIIKNAKTQRIGVCNACESIVVHRKIAKEFLPKLYEVLKENEVELRGDSYALECLGADKPLVKEAVEEDWGTEYLDYIMSVKIVDNVDEAIAHINKYNTSHSDAIVTKDYDVAQKFLDEVDSACVYVNASTRFSDGNEFGFGAEIGISTQKLHARGPMGLEALTSYKYIIYGSGQVRP
ncbi:MAG: glutamate-5-semialdehyde dehydrogenase [Lachnospiraceae bacterium]|nr:glutamate-5-semialdehyde dehydrogenase [Lachnospiraceae bacterium]